MTVNCVFCDPPEEQVFLRNELAYAMWDSYPVTSRHSLVIPVRHVPDWFGLTREELLACGDLLRKAKALVECENPEVQGFNLGANVGVAGGQTIFHCHIHLIPRRIGDVDNPRGGIRHVIAGKGYY